MVQSVAGSSEASERDGDTDATYDLGRLSLSSTVACGRAMRRFGRESRSMEGVAERAVRHLFARCRNAETGERDIALVRFFKTHPYGRLDAGLQAQARFVAGRAPLHETTKCLTLLATAGIQDEWNSRLLSTGHQAIPLTSEEAVLEIPMIAQLVSQFGLELSHVIAPDPELLVELDQRNYNVFHVEEAAGSRFIPAQENFVERFQIRSVVGFGGMLPTGNLSVMILFSRVPISRFTAEAFRSIALSIKTSILPFEDEDVFESDAVRRGANGDGLSTRDDRQQTMYLRSMAAALEELGAVYDQMVVVQSRHLEQVVETLQAVNQELTGEIETRKRIEAERERLNRQLIDASRKAGMAEIAVGVLHNVGNVLNSVNVSVSMLRRILDQSVSSRLEQVVELVDAHAGDLASFFTEDSRGKQLPPFLRLLASGLQDERAHLGKEVAALRTSIDHLAGIVSRQQEYSRFGGVQEAVMVNELLKDVIALSLESYQRHGIEVVCSDDVGLQLVVDKHQVLQILVNLVKNAKDAFHGGRQTEKRVELRVVCPDRKHVRIEVQDNGCGIHPENLTRIFSFGFTTKGDQGGLGFGLHHSALLAKELGGELHAASDGPGSGATLTLVLPIDGPGAAPG